MAFYLADGTEYEPGLEVTKTDDCPDSKHAYRLVRGYTVGDVSFEGSDPVCIVHFIESTRPEKAGHNFACLLKHLQFAWGKEIDFDEGAFLSMFEQCRV